MPGALRLPGLHRNDIRFFPKNYLIIIANDPSKPEKIA